MFSKTVKARYQIVAMGGSFESCALMILADGVASELDNLIDDPHEGEEADIETYELLRGNIVRPRENIVETFEAESERLRLDLKKYLPVDLVKKMVKVWEDKTKVPFAEMEDKEQHHVILNCLGHGVTPFDDTDFFDWLDEKGLDSKAVQKAWQGHQHFETDYNKVWEWLEDAVKAVKQEE